MNESIIKAQAPGSQGIDRSSKRWMSPGNLPRSSNLHRRQMAQGDGYPQSTQVV
ncbi:MAG: hypothetical protein AAFU71_18405 [Cyanobacteria bacterium J06632_22]